MAENKTQKTKASVSSFLKEISDAQTKKDCKTISKIMEEITQSKPKMWGTSIVGFGEYRYKSKSGREGDWFITGFSPRKQNLTLYLIGGINKHPELLKKLGKHKTSVGCLYIKSLEDIDLKVLKQLIKVSVKNLPGFFEN